MTIMNNTLRMIGCISLVLLLTTGTALSASGKLSGGTERKENKKLSGWIGVMVQDLNEKIVRKEKLDSDEGAYVKEVVEDSPADSAGIQENDVIVEFNGKKLFDSDDFVKLVRRTPPNTKVNLVLVRDGEKKTLYLTVGKRKEQQYRMFGGMPRIPNLRAFTCNHILGLRLLVLNEQLGEYFGAPNNEGVLVEEVEQKSAAEKAGFKAGDIIIRVGIKTVDAVEKIQRELQKYEAGDIVEFEIIRKSSNKILKVELEEQQCIRKNFFFPNPHIQMFQTDPSDGVEMQLDINEPQIDLDRLQKDIEKSTRNFKGWNNEI
jgi:predicted metalloprotease with PDZ domain